MRAVVADDHPLYREAVSLRLTRLVRGAEVEEIGTLDQLIDLAESRAGPVDLILLDLRMPGMAGGETVAKVVKAYPEAAVVLVSGAAEFEDIRRAVGAGARGFLPKTLSSKLFARAIAMILAGGTFLPAEVLQMNGLAQSGRASGQRDCAGLTAGLTAREQQVLVQLASGATNKEIGRDLSIAEVTVKLHIRQILRKINARNRSEAASIATRAGLI